MSALRNRRSASAFAIVIGAWSNTSVAQNAPPRAVASASPSQVFTGESLTLDATGSYDLDEGPQPLTYRWVQGDVTIGEGATHTWTPRETGPQSITLVVSDGDQEAQTRVEVHVLPALREPSVASSMMAIADAERELWVASGDHGAVVVVDWVSGMTQMLAVDGRPMGVALTADSAIVAVSSEGSPGEGHLTRISRGRGTVEAQLVTGNITDVLCSDVHDACFATNRQGDELVRTDGELTTIESRTRLRTGPGVMALSPDHSALFIAHFLAVDESAAITRIDLASGDVDELTLAEDPGPDTVASGRGVPNLLGALAIDPGGQDLWVGGLKANIRRGLHVGDEPAIPTNRLRALLAPVSIGTWTDEVQRRLDPNDSDRVSAIVFRPDGRWAFLAHPGAGSLSAIDMSGARLFDRENPVDTVTLTRFDAGDLPAALQISESGRDLFVFNELSRNVQIFDVTDPSMPLLRRAISLGDEPLDAQIAQGKRLFNSSRAPQQSQDGYIACASCHPSGGHDGLTWDFTQFGEGLRNTIDLRGHGVLQGLLHWSGNFDEVQDFELDIVHGFGGDGLLSAPPHDSLGEPNAGRGEELDALAAYVESLTTTPASPFRDAQGRMTASAIEGRAVFAEAGCATCHTGAQYTDSRLTPPYVRHDVGTLLPSSGMRLGGELDGLDTPTLLGVWASAPYLHDGRAKALRDVFTVHNPNDRHGRTSDLGGDEIDALVDYLDQLDGRPEEGPTPPTLPPPNHSGGCSAAQCGAPPTAPSSLVFVALALLIARRRK